METIFKESLFDYDGPFLFIVQSGSDQYMAVKIRQNDSYKYIVVPVLEQQIREAKMGKKSVDDIFMVSYSWFVGHFTSGRLHFELEKQESPISILSKYFDGTFYLDPEDYEDESAPCKSFLENDLHISTVWKEECSKTEKINATSISPLVKFNKDINKNRELNFSCDCSCFIEMQYLKDHAA